MRSGRQNSARARKPKPAARKRQSHKPEASGPAPKEQRPPAPAIDQVAAQAGDLTPVEVLRLQNDLGNQAVSRLLARGDGAAAPAVARPTAVPGLPPARVGAPADARLKKAPPAVQRLLTSKKLDQRLGGYYQGEEVSKDEATEYDRLKFALEEFHDYDKEFKKLKPDYLDHTLRLEMIRQVIARAEGLLAMLKTGADDRKAIIQKVRSEAVDTFVKASPNAERAKVARKELKAKKALDKNPTPRLTDDLIEMMVLSVASPIDELDIKGQAGHLGINTANNAADALIMMQQKDFEKIKSLLEQSGDDLGEVAKKATLLKAVAARKNDLIAGGPQSAMQMFVLELFGGIIRGMDKDVMV
ncbi:MAG: hypothetical protein PVH65_08980, partial [Chloroflexota bacterium]